MSSDERVFVCFRWVDVQPEDDSIAADARALSQRIDAEGGMVAAWLLPTLVACFEIDSWQQAVELSCDRAQALPLAVGIAASRSALVDVAGRRVGFAVGPGVARSVALSELATSGEVLVEPDAEPYRRGALLASATLRGVARGARVRGRRLDPTLPWRDVNELGLGRIRAPLWTGSPAPADLGWGVGALSLVFAPRGSGGTRFLSEVVRERPEARVLHLRPGPPGEPLGSLRLGLSKVLASELVAPALAGDYAVSFETFLAGEGLDHESALKLIETWFGSDARAVGNAIALDEADTIDMDTLSVVAAACRELDLCVLSRVVDPVAVPEPLAALHRAHELRLPAATAKSATELVQALVSGAFEDRLALRFARRGGFSAVAMQQALALAIENGELVWSGERFAARGRKRGRGRAHGIDGWVARRLVRRSAEERGVLSALAVLGGDAHRSDVEALAQRMGVTIGQTACHRLSVDGWLERPAGPTLAIASSAVAGAIRSALGTDELCLWHRATAEMLEAIHTPMSLARAAVHRLLSADASAAAAAARKASAAVRGAGLSETADAFEQLSRSVDPEPLIARRLLPEVLVSESRRVVESLRAPARADDAAVTESKAPGGPAVQRRLDELIRQFELEAEDVDVGRVLGSWRSRDFAALEQYVSELRQEPSRAALADRVAALTLLARRRVGEALQILRRSKTATDAADGAARSRAGLALGIGLAAAGRTTEALLETLDSLARARAAADTHGERACARFLAELSRNVGADYAAARWNLLGAG